MDIEAEKPLKLHALTPDELPANSKGKVREPRKPRTPQDRKTLPDEDGYLAWLKENDTWQADAIVSTVKKNLVTLPVNNTVTSLGRLLHFAQCFRSIIKNGLVPCFDFTNQDGTLIKFTFPFPPQTFMELMRCFIQDGTSQSYATMNNHSTALFKSERRFKDTLVARYYVRYGKPSIAIGVYPKDYRGQIIHGGIYNLSPPKFLEKYMVPTVPTRNLATAKEDPIHMETIEELEEVEIIPEDRSLPSTYILFCSQMERRSMCLPDVMKCLELEQTVTIGSGSTDHLQSNIPGLLPAHIVLSASKGIVFATPRSDSDTKLNDVTITKKTALFPGSLLVLANTWRFEMFLREET